MSVFEIVRGPEGDCLLLDDTRISGPKPWGGGTVVSEFRTDGAYDAVLKDDLDRLKTESAELREFLADLAGHIKHGDGHGVDLGWVIDRMRELGIEVGE